MGQKNCGLHMHDTPCTSCALIFFLSNRSQEGASQTKSKFIAFALRGRGLHTEITARAGSIGIVGVPSGARRFGPLETCERRKCEEGRIC